MKNSIKVGPIKKSAKIAMKPVTSVIKERLDSLKVGTFFEISGFSSPREIQNTRGLVWYYAKQKNIKFSTSVTNDVLIVERVKYSPVKTKEVPAV
jgi:hypothetical protein